MDKQTSETANNFCTMNQFQYRSPAPTPNVSSLQFFEWLRQARLRLIGRPKWRNKTEADIHPRTPPESHPDIEEKLEQLRPDDWMEFIDEARGISQMGKLVWINKSTSNHLFVNRSGRLLAVKRRNQLADDLRTGKIKFPAPKHLIPKPHKVPSPLHAFFNKLLFPL